MNSCTFLYLILWPWLALCLNTNLTLGMAQDSLGERLDDLSLRRYNADLVDCQNSSGFKASENISECDLLAEAAAHLAVERVNQDPDILPNITLKLYPIYVPSRRESQADGGFYDILIQMLDLLRSNDSDRVWGVIGPGDDPNVANFIASISENSGLIIISYGSTTNRDHADNVSTFYRTLPSGKSANYGRLVLLEKHDWYRIGILKSSEEEHYFKESSQFVLMFNEYVEKGLFNKINLDLTESFKYSPEPALRSMKSRDINVIVGFFGPANARRVLCQAESIGLISSEHAWILPSYYNPNWWKSPPNSTDGSCPDEKMRDILESVIFVDTVKLPPVNLSLDDFHNQLLFKAHDWFPSLTVKDLKPYLLRSRATSAYDAVTLLARSVGVAFNQDGDSCANTSMIQVVLDQEFLGCEYCLLYSIFPKCFDLSMSFEDCEECYVYDSKNLIITPEYISDLYHYYNDSKSKYLLNVYGQILYSQFQGGEECPIILWWPGLSAEDHMYRKGYIPISNFDDETTDFKCISEHVTLSRKDFVSNSSKCLKGFNWRGSPIPPSSRYLEVFHIPLGVLITMGISVLLGFLAAILLIIFNILCRTNKIVKATSPWLNVILLSGIMIRLPSTLLYGLSVSSGHYSRLAGRDWTPLCHIGLWQYYIGDGLFVATLIAKNWRIYRIFFNKGLKQRGNRLANDALTVGILVTVFPLLIILIVWSTLGVRFETYSFQNNNLQIINYTTCFPENRDNITFEFVTNGYILFLLICLFILSLVTASVPSATFRREGVATYKAVVFTLLPAPFVFLTRLAVLLSRNPEQFEALLWIEFCWTAMLPFILFMVLFAPTIHAVLRSYVEEKLATSEDKEQRRLTLQYNDLRHKTDVLKVQLNELDNNILKIKADLALPVYPNSSDGMSKTEKSISEANEPNKVIDGAGKVDLTSINTAGFVTAAADHNKLTKAGEISDVKLNSAASDSKTIFLSTGSTTEALVPANDSAAAFDSGTPSLNNQTVADTVRTADYPCLIQAENVGDREACSGKTDLCTSDQTKNTISCKCSHPVTSNEVNIMTVLSGSSNRDSSQH